MIALDSLAILAALIGAHVPEFLFQPSASSSPKYSRLHAQYAVRQDNDYYLGGLGSSGTALFNWHPVLMVSGLIVSYTQGETWNPSRVFSFSQSSPRRRVPFPSSPGEYACMDY